jgi:hypothetical protein
MTSSNQKTNLSSSLPIYIMFKKVFELLFKVDKPTLGRWKLKSCNDITTSRNSIYQNRDHCGDSICKSPVKADEYLSTVKQPK